MGLQSEGKTSDLSKILLVFFFFFCDIFDMDRIGEVKMKEKKNKYIKTNIIGFVIAMVIVSGFAVYAAVTFPSKDVTYENGTSGLESNNVQGAIDEIYNICTALPPATDTITDLLPSNPDELYEDEHGDIRYYGKRHQIIMLALIMSYGE